jgi:hypothetical protein
LIEIQGGDDDNATCRISHSSVVEFLSKCQGDVFDDKECVISQDILARACLGYLRRERYEKLLAKEQESTGRDAASRSGGCQREVWLDQNGDSIEDHHFLLYAAKHWHIHLEQLHDSSLREATMAFLCSSNFRTLIQVQSLFVDHRFCPCTDTEKKQTALLTVLPRWFARSDPNIQKVWVESRRFVHEWRYLLNVGCPDCELGPFRHLLRALDCLWVDPSERHDSLPGLLHDMLRERAPLRQFTGQLESVSSRWDVFGPDSFLSDTDFAGQYMTFSLLSQQIDGTVRVWEGIDCASRCVKLIKLR